MKHLLNNLSEEEKNSIREQHTGGMKIAIDNFKRLVETKQGDVKPYLNESITGKGLELFIKGQRRINQQEPDFRVMIIGPLKFKDNHHISIPVASPDKSRKGQIVTWCNTDRHGYTYWRDGETSVENEIYDVTLSNAGENIVKPEIERLCGQFVSNDNGDDMSNMA